MPYHDFTEMPVWQLAIEIVEEAYKLTEKLPKREDYALCGQLRKAAVSIAGNIAEGFGRYGKKDKIKFYRYSQGSLSESLNWNEKSKIRKLLSAEEYKYIFGELQKLPKAINALILFTNQKLKV